MRIGKDIVWVISRLDLLQPRQDLRRVVPGLRLLPRQCRVNVVLVHVPARQRLGHGVVEPVEKGDALGGEHLGLVDVGVVLGHPEGVAVRE